MKPKFNRRFVHRAVVGTIFFFAGLAGLAVQGQGQGQTVLPDAPKPVERSSSFFHRLATYYGEDWSGTLPSSAAPVRRLPASPLDSPPFPNADWSYSGSQEIGAPDTGSYPLMTALNGAKSRTKVYGWVEPSFNLSTSGDSNAPVAYDQFANRVELQQLVVIVERLADTVQTKHWDFGYHLTGIFGTDYYFTTGKGYFSQQLLKFNRQYGADLPVEYVDLYVPKVAKGVDVRVGRFSSIPGIESQWAPGNYIFSHSLVNTFDALTDTGLLATVKLSDRWLVQAGISAGHDVAPWTDDAKASGTACLDYTSGSVKDSLYVCANGINSGKYAYDNIQQYDGTWYHRFSKTWHMATESWFMYERDVPNAAGPLPIETGTYGAVCQPGELRCLAPEYAAVNYLEHEISPSLMMSFRSDFMNDKKGQRTGYAGRYAENTLSLTKWFGSTVEVRPEVRFDRSYDRPAYDKGRSSNQFTFASDLIYRF